jgi:hypothetical protein
MAEEFLPFVALSIPELDGCFSAFREAFDSEYDLGDFCETKPTPSAINQVQK